MNSLSKGVVIATAAATLVLSGTVAARAAEKGGGEVHCAGLNACKGQGACKTASNACKGQNSCKGQGYLETASADECTAKGGKILGS